MFFFFCKQKTAYEMRISDWSSDVCSSDLLFRGARGTAPGTGWPVDGGRPRADPARCAGDGADVRARCRLRRPAAAGRLAAAHHDLAREHRNHGRRRLAASRTHEQASRKARLRSEEHTSELQSLMRISYAVFCLKKKKKTQN